MQNPDPINSDAESRQLRERLQAATAFRGLEGNELDALLCLMVREEFAADEVIIRQETVTQNVWLLLEGQCEVIKQPPIGTFGTPVPLAQLHPFDVFGEMSISSVEPHVASVEAKTAVRTLRLRGADFDKLIDDQPRVACRVACNLLCIVSERLRTVDERLSRCLDGHEEMQIRHTWEELRDRMGKLYAG